MFNIKSIVKQITERSKDSTIESPSKSTDGTLLQKTEGFLCPKCMKQLPSPWELQSHYETVHEADVSSELSLPSLPGELSFVTSPDDVDEQSAIDLDVSVCGDGVSTSLALEDVPFISDVQDLQEKLQQTLSRKATLETRVVRLVQSNVTLKAAVDEMDRELTQLRERHKILEAQLAHRESIDDAAVLRQELVQVQRVMDEMNREREKERDDLQAKLTQLQQKESDSMIDTLRSSLNSKEQECKQLTEELENLRTKYDDEIKKKENTEKHEVCLSEVENTVDSPYLSGIQDALEHGSSEKGVQYSPQNSLIEVETRNHVESEPDSDMQKTLDIKNEELSALTRILEEMKEELANKNRELTRICRELETAKQTTVTHSKKLDEQHKELNEMLNKEKKICSNLNVEIKKISEEKSLLENKLHNSVRECSAAQSTVTNLQQSLTELQNEYQNVQSEHEQQRQMLRAKIQEKSELMQKQEDAVQILVSERTELTRQLELLEARRLRETEEASQKLRKLQDELEEKTEAQKELENSLLSETEKSRCLQEKLSELNESSNAAIHAKNEEIKVLRTSLDEMTGEKLALEAQLEATGSEQQKLLERCYASTTEIETLQHTVAELRRKWEESESALQELGRENATLQLDIEKLLARKWAEDADVTQCTVCHREFTMILRKHHCRNCGQIFCNECSSKTAAVVSNKKPVRVCDSCYTELRTN